MNERIKKLAAEAEELPPDQRAELVDRILETMLPVDEDIQAAWTHLAEERLEDYRSGRTEAVDADIVLARLGTKFSGNT